MEGEIRVLHVDDDRPIAELTATFLTRADDRFVVDIETSAADALETLETTPVDCVISDYDMPGMDGIEFLEAVRERFPDLPFMLFTGKGSEDVASEAISKGVTDYLRKQTGTEHYALLANRIENAVTQYRNQGALETNQTVLSTLIENLPVGILVEDQNREIRAVNTRLLEQFDAPGEPADYIGYDCETLATEIKSLFRRPERFIESIEQCLEDRQPVTGEPFELENGQLIERDYVPYTLAGGEANLWVYTDVTDERERQLTLEGLFSQSLDGIAVHQIVTDDAGEPIDYVFQQVNDRFEELTGLEREAVVGKRATMVFEDFEDAPFIDIYGEVALEGTPTRFEQYSEPLDRHYEIAAFSPHEERFITIFTDITERKQRERELEQFKFFVEQTPDFMVILNEDFTARYQSPVSEAIDYEPLEISGDDPLDHIHPDDREAVVAGFERVIENPNTIDRTQYRAKVSDGSWRWFESRHQNYFGKPPIDGLLITIREITDLKTKEQRLERQRDRFEEFASVVSHDLRNPLTIASGYLEQLEGECESNAIDEIVWALDRMETLIEDMLALARQGDHVGDTDAVSVPSVVDACWSMVETGDATLSCTTDVVIEADETRFTQLLENLFRNAIEHGGKDVAVTVGDLENGGIYVADDGPGIPPERREAVFEAGHSSTADGTGFGLAIVDQIATAHGWEVSVTASETGGARIEIWMP